MPRSLRSPFRRDLIKHSPSANGRCYGVDAATRTLQLRLEVDNADEALKPGMNAVATQYRQRTDAAHSVTGAD